ncbi:MAG: hypothetical protein PHS54_00170 [Clostridia bacterium]|nr:hypothetical protein [Clostridia bacterium]
MFRKIGIFLGFLACMATAQTPSLLQTVSVNTNTHVLNRSNFSGSDVLFRTNNASVLISTSGDLYLQGTNYGPTIANAITNNQGGMLATTNSAGVPYTKFSGSGGLSGVSMEAVNGIKITDWNSSYHLANGANFNILGLNLPSGGGITMWNGAINAWRLYLDPVTGDISIPNGNLTVPNNRIIIGTPGWVWDAPLMVYGNVSAQGFQWIDGLISGGTIRGNSGLAFTYLDEGFTKTAISWGIDGNISIPNGNLNVSGNVTATNINKIYTPITNQTVGTIAILPNQQIYKINTATAITVSNDVSALVFDGTSNANWEVWLNLTDWSATNSTFAANIEWETDKSELTVTGYYKYAFSSTDGKIKARQTFPTGPVSTAPIYSYINSNILNEIIVDKTGLGDFNSITSALAYVATIHATNSTLAVYVHLAIGDYYENPTVEAWTILKGDARRSRIYGTTTIKSNPVFISDIYFRATTAGQTPVIFQDVASSSLGTFANCYIYNGVSYAGNAYAFQVINSPNMFLNIANSEFYVNNGSTDANAKSIVFGMDSGDLEVVNTRLKTSSNAGHAYENEFLVWMENASWIQMENSHYLSVHDDNPRAHIDGTSGIYWIDSGFVNNQKPDNFLKIEGSSLNPMIYFAKETGNLRVNGALSFAPTINGTNINNNVNKTNLYVYSDGISLFKVDENSVTTKLVDATGLYQNMSNFPSTVIGGTSTIQVVEGTTIYNVTVTNNTTVKFDLSNLNFVNKVATFELWVEYLNVSASLGFGNVINWVNETPTFTTISTNYLVMRALNTNTIHGNIQYTY